MQNETAVGPGAFDVLLVGAGAVGLTLGVALAQAGLRVALAGVADTRPNGRTVALLEGSVALLASLGLWQRLEPEAEPLRVMRLVDATGSLFRGPPLEFRAAEIGREDFGRNIENHRLVAALDDMAVAAPGARATARTRRQLRLRGRWRAGARHRRQRGRGGARGRDRRSPLDGARGGRDRGARDALSAARADGDARTHAAASRRLDRIPHAPGPVHAGAAARHCGRAAPVEPSLGHEPGGRRPSSGFSTRAIRARG